MICTYVNHITAKDGAKLTELHWIDPDDNNKVSSRFIQSEKISGIDNLVPGVVFVMNLGITSSNKAYIKGIVVTDGIVESITF